MKKKYELDGTLLLVNTKTNTLLKAEGIDSTANFCVPHVLPSGMRINHIGPHAFVGTWGTISFSDSYPLYVDKSSFVCIKANILRLPIGMREIPAHCFEKCEIECIQGLENVISIAENAFDSFKCDTFQWPSNVSRIPINCFRNSKIENITGIENVVEVGEAAFSCARFDTFTWPSGTVHIPNSCFAYSCLKEIKGIEKVTSVGDRAFVGTQVTFFNWPKNATAIPDYCFSNSSLQYISGVEKVYSIGELAFSNTELLSLDLLSSNILEIGEGAFWGLKKDTISKPYYMLQRDFDAGFVLEPNF